ncbi:hypothetical protein [Nonomuraea sp. NPDC049709]|uniref:hypothetical protein n=1 Tax=Nonomuraea sp. NPDC049709 TaxID=3154736 RepID=UPI003440048A
MTSATVTLISGPSGQGKVYGQGPGEVQRPGISSGDQLDRERFDSGHGAAEQDLAVLASPQRSRWFSCRWTAA